MSYEVDKEEAMRLALKISQLPEPSSMWLRYATSSLHIGGNGRGGGAQDCLGGVVRTGSHNAKVVVGTVVRVCSGR
jgi:hypothetical protein